MESRDEVGGVWTMDGAVPDTSARAGWHARLDLEFEARPDRTVLARRKHEGPLCVQRPFHPDEDGTCHVYVLHPPGGVAGSDVLELNVALHENARALLTMPAATKLYRSGGQTSRIEQRLTVKAGALLRWLPQETIAFDGARAKMLTRIDLEAGAHAIAWEVLCLGRPVSKQPFEHGALRTALEVYRGGAPLVIDRARFIGDDSMLHAAYGMRGLPVLGTLICTAGDDSWVDALREATSERWPESFSATRMPGAIVCRYLGARVEDAHNAFRCALDVLSEKLLGQKIAQPRIWLT
jgi:urease accessory protein